MARKMPDFSAPKVVYKSERNLTKFKKFNFQTENRSEIRKSKDLLKVTMIFLWVIIVCLEISIKEDEDVQNEIKVLGAAEEENLKFETIQLFS